MSKLQKRIIYFGTNGCVGHYPLGINFTLSKEEYNDFGEIDKIMTDEILDENTGTFLRYLPKGVAYVCPASEEAKKELFDKMEEAGYKWNADTLELEKIVPKFKEGDIIINKEGSIFLISKIFDNGNTLEMAAVLNKGELTINPNVWQSPYGKSIASEEDRNRLFSALAKKGYIYDKEQFIKQEFKSFDKVLVKDMPNHNWSIDLFSHYDEKNKDYPYVCLTSRYRYCIPYEGNEYLVGKTAN